MQIGHDEMAVDEVTRYKQTIPKDKETGHVERFAVRNVDLSFTDPLLISQKSSDICRI